MKMKKYTFTNEEKQEIKKALKDDYEIPGATLETTESVVIK